MASRKAVVVTFLLGVLAGAGVMWFGPVNSKARSVASFQDSAVYLAKQLRDCQARELKSDAP